MTIEVVELLQRVRTTLTPTPASSRPDRDSVEYARVRLDDLDIIGKRQVLDLLGVRAEVTGYRPCPTCIGAGYTPIPPGAERHWPPSCPTCHRLTVVPDLTVDIGQADLLIPQPSAEPDTQTAG